MKPAIVAAKLKICAAVAGATGVSIKCFPPAPVATTKTRRDGAQAQFSYQLRTLSPQKDTKREINEMITIPTVQLMLAILARAWPPSMQFRVQKPTLLMSESKLGTMAP
jgi:hypothetical protein